MCFHQGLFNFWTSALKSLDDDAPVRILYAVFCAQLPPFHIALRLLHIYV